MKWDGCKIHRRARERRKGGSGAGQREVDESAEDDLSFPAKISWRFACVAQRYPQARYGARSKERQSFASRSVQAGSLRNGEGAHMSGAELANEIERTVFFREIDVVETDHVRLKRQIANFIRSKALAAPLSASEAQPPAPRDAQVDLSAAFEQWWCAFWGDSKDIQQDVLDSLDIETRAAVAGLTKKAFNAGAALRARAAAPEGLREIANSTFEIRRGLMTSRNLNIKTVDVIKLLDGILGNYKPAALAASVERGE